MARILLPLAASLFFTQTAFGAPASASAAAKGPASSALSAAPAFETVPLATDNSNDILWLPDTNTIPQAIRGSLGGSILGPSNLALDRQNADFLAPPTTDAGTVYASLSRPYPS